jgi:hypothetical protein
MEKRSQLASDGFLSPLHVLSKQSMLAFIKGSFSSISECLMCFPLDASSSTALTLAVFSFFTTALAVFCGIIFLHLVRAEDANGSKVRDAFLFSRSLKGGYDASGKGRDGFLFSRSLKGEEPSDGLDPPTPNPPTPNPPTPNPPTPNPPTPTGAGDGIELMNGVKSAKFPLQPQDMDIFFISVPSSSTVTCTTDAAKGDLDLYMNQIGLPESYDCESDSQSALESCTISARPGKVYAFTFAFTQVSDYTVTCTIE